jgi:hypothetical protein
LAKEDILIVWDDIHIYMIPESESDRVGVEKKMVVRYKHSKKLNLTGAVPSQLNADSGTFKFGMFDGGFSGQHSSSSDQGHGRAGFVHVSTQPGSGQKWEFVS